MPQRPPTRSRKPPTRPRKSASQARSRLTVDALLEATARILVKEGYDRASTNKIAMTAGVSIGSLYQYFPSKEALVSAVVDRHTQAMAGEVREALERMASWPVEAAARALIAAMIEAHRVAPQLHRILEEQVPRVGRLENIKALDREIHAAVRAYLAAHDGEHRAEDHDLAAFVCVTAVEALTHAAVLQRPELLSRERAGIFIDEVTQLIVGYLQPER